MLQFVESHSEETSFIANLKQEYRFAYIFLRITWLNGGTPATEDDLGRITYHKRGDNQVYLTARALRTWVDYNGGSSTFSSAASVTGEWYAFIPRNLGDGNIDLVTPADSAYIRVDYGPNFAGRVSAVRADLFVVPAVGANRYDLTLNQQWYSSVGAGATGTQLVEKDNIVQILVSDYTNQPETIGTGSPGGMASGSIRCEIADSFTQADVQDYISWTNCVKQLEVTADDATYAVVYDANTLGIPAGNGLADKATVHVTPQNVACTATLVAVGMRFAKTNYKISTARQASILNQVRDIKEGAGKFTAVDRLTEAGILPPKAVL